MIKIDIKKFAKELKKSADYLAEHKKEGGCYRFSTTQVEDKNVSIVLGWSGGFDKNENDKYISNGFRLCAKVAYQPINSMMQCDYEIDFKQVYHRCDGEFYDTEVVLYPDCDFESAAKSLIEDYVLIILHWNWYKHD